MYIASKFYSVRYEKDDNRIIIKLPQTTETAKNTTAPTVSRKTELTYADLIMLLAATQLICEGEISDNLLRP